MAAVTGHERHLSPHR